MCVLLCASSKVHDWLDLPLARAYREALQLCPVCSDIAVAEAGCNVQPAQTPLAKNFELDEAAQRRVMKRSAWLQAYCRYNLQGTPHGQSFADCSVASASSREWHKALEAIAQTWGRLLSFVGLRW
jgi:hypothetical protein